MRTTTDPVALARAVTALREEVARLAGRVAVLEREELDDELLLVLSAAIAAYLGKKPYLRQVRLVRSATWSHQGRVSIQGSHALAVPHRPGVSR
jgi:hypothetical protein